MNRFRTIFIAVLLGLTPLALVTSSGCAPQGESVTPSERTISIASKALLVTRLAVEGAHKTFWSDPLRQRASECASKPRAEAIACMGEFTPENNERIVQALEVYASAARAAGEAVNLSIHGSSTEGVRVLTLSCIRAGLKAAELIPGADASVRTLQGVLGMLS